MLNNKLGITNEIELSKMEEKITKLKALELFDTNKIDELSKRKSSLGIFKGKEKKAIQEQINALEQTKNQQL